MESVRKEKARVRLKMTRNVAYCSCLKVMISCLGSNIVLPGA
ncbi:hypothetical protein LEMLEM_LOCUS23161 [Lemmus lemmus]